MVRPLLLCCAAQDDMVEQSISLGFGELCINLSVALFALARANHDILDD